MKCIVGLGNPGDRYRETRHNVGFLAIEFLMNKFGARSFEETNEYRCFQVPVKDDHLLFLLPQTFMNDSGVAVREIMQRHDLSNNDLLIVYDDFQLPFGTLRIRPHGSDGGHNGIASIIYHLESDQVSRLRVGVGGITIPGEHTHEAMAEYVLSPFTKEEQKLIPPLFGHLHDACVMWIESGIQKTMSLYNKNFFSSAGAE